MSYINRSVSGTLAASGAGSSRPAGNCNETDMLILAHTLRGEGFDASEDGTGRGIPIVPVYSFSDKDNGRDVAVEVSPTLRTSSVHPAIAPTLTRYNLDSRSPQSEEQQKIVRGVYESTGAVRRLTPRECERLQGFPDDYTKVPYRKKPASDSCRYKSLGNSMAVPCMSWIGKRIATVEQILKERD